MAFSSAAGGVLVGSNSQPELCNHAGVNLEKLEADHGWKLAMRALLERRQGVLRGGQRGLQDLHDLMGFQCKPNGTHSTSFGPSLLLVRHNGCQVVRNFVIWYA
jgi:hypothetical protein